MDTETIIANIWSILNENAKQMAESRRMLEHEQNKRAEESRKASEQRAEESRKASEQSRKEFGKILKDLSKKIADLGDAMGLYAEAQTKERIREMFADRGIELRTITTHYIEEDGKGGFLYEIDILLYNTIYAIVVEVKHQLKKDDVDYHLERMEKCVQFPPKGTEGKMLLACLATMIVSKEVESYAKKQGLYVIKPSGESVKIANGMNFKPKTWQV